MATNLIQRFCSHEENVHWEAGKLFNEKLYRHARMYPDCDRLFLVVDAGDALHMEAKESHMLISLFAIVTMRSGAYPDMHLKSM